MLSAEMGIVNRKSHSLKENDKASLDKFEGSGITELVHEFDAINLKYNYVGSKLFSGGETGNGAQLPEMPTGFFEWYQKMGKGCRILRQELEKINLGEVQSDFHGKTKGKGVDIKKVNVMELVHQHDGLIKGDHYDDDPKGKKAATKLLVKHTDRFNDIMAGKTEDGEPFAEYLLNLRSAIESLRAGLQVAEKYAEISAYIQTHDLRSDGSPNPDTKAMLDHFKMIKPDSDENFILTDPEYLLASSIYEYSTNPESSVPAEYQEMKDFFGKGFLGIKEMEKAFTTSKGDNLIEFNGTEKMEAYAKLKEFIANPDVKSLLDRIRDEKEEKTIADVRKKAGIPSETSTKKSVRPDYWVLILDHPDVDLSKLFDFNDAEMGTGREIIAEWDRKKRPKKEDNEGKGSKIDWRLVFNGPDGVFKYEAWKTGNRTIGDAKKYLMECADELQLNPEKVRGRTLAQAIADTLIMRENGVERKTYGSEIVTDGSGIVDVYLNQSGNSGNNDCASWGKIDKQKLHMDGYTVCR